MHHGDQLLVPYQWLLRAIGAELDTLQASLFTVIEEANGFAVRFHLASTQQEWRVLHFSYEELLAYRTHLEGRQSKRIILRKGVKPGGYQDMLRALGYELEQAHAYSILVDELEEGFFFTYLALDPSQGYVPRKRLVVVDRAQREQLLREASARRGTQTKGRLLS